MISSAALLTVVMGMVAGVMTFGLPFSTYKGSYDHERRQVLDNLSLVADLKKDRVELWLHERKGDVESLAGSRAMVSAAAVAANIVDQAEKEGKTDSDVAAALLANREVRDLICHLKLIDRSYGDYSGIQVVHAASGMVLASTLESQVGRHVLSEQFLAAAVEAANRLSMGVERDPGGDQTYLLMARGVENSSDELVEARERLVGLVVAYIPTESLTTPLKHTGRGLGKTGEIVLVDRDARILTPLKFPLADGTRPSALDYQVKARPAQLASQGHEGIIEARDYRGVPVLAAYRYINFGSDLGCGMVVKMDQAEAFGPVWTHVMYSFIVGSVGLFLAVALTFIAAGKILLPLRGLSETARRVEAGDVTVRADGAGPDEVGALAATFNSMLDRIENWGRDLEEQVQDRTARLNMINSALQEEVTERTRAEQELDTERQRLAVTLRSIGDGVITTDTNGMILALNEVGERLTGWKEDEAMGLPIGAVLKLVGEEGASAPEIPVRQVVESRETRALDENARLRRKDGEERFIEDSVAPVKDASGDILGTVLVFRDVTERKAGERALAESEERFRAIFEKGPLGMSILSPDFRWIEANDALSRMLGYDREELSRMTPWNVSHPDEVERDRLAMHRLVAGDLTHYNVEKRYITKHGEIIWVALFSSAVRDEKGAVRYLLTLAQDITQRRRAEEALRESEERFRQLAENIQDAFWLTAPGRPRCVVYVSPAHERMWGLTPEEIYKKPGAWLDSLFPEDRERVVEAYEAFLQGHGDYSPEYRILCPDGAVRWILDRAFAVRDSEGKIHRIAGLAQDITQRKASEEQLHHLVEEIKQFAYIVSHDLSAPLINLRGFCQELVDSMEVVRSALQKALPALDEAEARALKRALDEDAPESLMFINSSVQRMERLISAILTLSRAGRRNLEPAELDMNQLVRETLNTMTHQITERGVTVTVGDLPEVVADHVSMEQIMSNLLNNAINYLDPARAGLVEIVGERHGEETVFHVRDNGIGIDPEDRDSVFQLFRRLQVVNTPGEGMGLAYVNTLVRRHGGRIWLDSERGKGSTFSFTIPLRALYS